jgi:hypothetical protein
MLTAKYKQIACTGLKPQYNGSAKELIPTLNLIHIRRQNKTWYPITILRLQDVGRSCAAIFISPNRDTRDEGQRNLG